MLHEILALPRPDLVDPWFHQGFFGTIGFAINAALRISVDSAFSALNSALASFFSSFISFFASFLSALYSFFATHVVMSILDHRITGIGRRWGGSHGHVGRNCRLGVSDIDEGKCGDSEQKCANIFHGKSSSVFIKALTSSLIPTGSIQSTGACMRMPMRLRCLLRITVS
jgi:hypothetical protein